MARKLHKDEPMRFSLFFAAPLLGLIGCDSAPTTTKAAATQPVAATGANGAPGAQDALTRVADLSLVCMVNDQFMGRPQIPVAVEGRTYFGCCENCKTKLATDPTSRTGVDPVTGAPVDKATAIVGQQPDGKVLYFASEDTFARYAATQRAR
jgi:YHS domain-containing protein